MGSKHRIEFKLENTEGTQKVSWFEGSTTVQEIESQIKKVVTNLYITNSDIQHYNSL